MSKMGIEFNRGSSKRLANARLALSHHRAFHCMERINQSIDVSDVHPTIPTGWQRTAGDEMNIGVPAAHEQNSLSGLDTGIDL